LDKAANRVVYERTLTALLQVALDGKQPKVTEMLVAAKVGDVDSHVGAMQASSQTTKDGEVPRAAQIAAEVPKGLDQKWMEKIQEEIKAQVRSIPYILGGCLHFFVFCNIQTYMHHASLKLVF